MGYYDIGEKYEEGKPLTYTSLCKEIMDEYENATGCTPPGEETIREAEGVTDENRCQITIADNYYLTSAE